ncbi:Calcium and integrin-binding family member 3, partial [Fragariocoptes setiger]
MSDEDSSTIRVSRDKLEKMVELKENPLKERICKVFSSDGSGDMTFDDFLNMCSIFNEQSPRDTKLHYAFQIYDFDEDGFIGLQDMKTTLITLTKNRLTSEEVDMVCQKVLDEADHDQDGKISFLEFKHVVSRSPDFMR